MVRAAQSWEQVHAGLAEIGIILRAKGSGHVLVGAGQTAKLSHLGLGGMSKLERRLGDYTPPTAEHQATAATAPAMASAKLPASPAGQAPHLLEDFQH